MVLCPGTPEGSTASCSDFKASPKTGQQLKVSSDRLKEAWNQTCDPWFTRHRFIPYTTVASPAQPKHIFVAVFLGCTRTGRVGLCFLWFYAQELPKAQPAVVLVLKRLRRRGNGLKSHPTDWEKPGIEPATPGLQDIGLSPTPRRLLLNPNICSGPSGYSKVLFSTQTYRLEISKYQHLTLNPHKRL